MMDCRTRLSITVLMLFFVYMFRGVLLSQGKQINMCFASDHDGLPYKHKTKFHALPLASGLHRGRQDRGRHR